MTWRRATLGDICSLTKGATGITKAVPGPYPLVALSEERKSHNAYQFDAAAVIIPLVSSTGHGHASLKRIHFQEGRFALGSILCALIPKNGEEVLAEYLFHYLDLMKEVLFVPLMKGMANVSLPMKRIAAVEVPLPSIDEQEEAIAFLRKHREICESMQKESGHRQTLLVHYRQKVLQEAIGGTLTADWREANPDVAPASELLACVAAEKAELVKTKKIRKQKPLPPVTEEQQPFTIPDTWQWCKMWQVFLDSRYGTATKCTPVSGGTPVLRIPNVSSGKIDLSGLKYADLSEKEQCDLALSAGDIIYVRSNGSSQLVGVSVVSTPELEGFAFAGYLVRLRLSVENVLPRFLQLLINGPYIRSYIEPYLRTTTGVKNINNTEFGSLSVPLPPLAEQQEIVRRVSAKFALCDALEAEITATEKNAHTLSAAILQELFDQAEG